MCCVCVVCVCIIVNGINCPDLRERQLKNSFSVRMDSNALLRLYSAYITARRQLHVEEIEHPFEDVKQSR